MTAQPPYSHPRVAATRILLTGAWIFVVALWPMRAWAWHALTLGILVILSLVVRLSAGKTLRRLMVVWAFSALMGLGLVGQPDWPLRVGNLLLKATLSLWAMSVLVHCTPLPELVMGLRWLRVPRVLTGSFAFWARYYSVLLDEWHRLQLARRARTIEKDRHREFKALSNTLGLLFVRAYERAEQVHRAMLARGYREE